MESVQQFSVALPPLLSVHEARSRALGEGEEDEPPMLIPTQLQQQQQQQQSYPSPDDRDGDAELSPRESHAGQFRLQLWQFLLLLLSRPDDFGSAIKWTDDTGEFKVFDTEELARLWGGRKGRNTMNYDKLSRSLRYYYDKGILKKVTGQRLVYRFDGDIHRRHVQQLKQGLSGVVALVSTRSPGTSAQLADSPAAQHTSDELVIKQVKRERQDRHDGAEGSFVPTKHVGSAKRPRKEKSGIEEHQASSMEASLLFGRALREGCITLPRTRLFLIGPRKSGKSSLKKLLLGLTRAADEAVTDVVDADTQVAVFDPNSAYHADSCVRSSLPWKLADVRHSRLREFERRVSKWVAADLMSFSHETVQHRILASQQAMLHRECHQMLTTKGSSSTAVMSSHHGGTGSSAPGGIPPPGIRPAPETPSRTPPKPSGLSSPTTAGLSSATGSGGFPTAQGAMRPMAVAGSSNPRFVAPVSAGGSSSMYWTQPPGSFVNGTPSATIMQPLYLPTLSPGPFFLSPPPQAAQRYMVPTIGGNLVSTPNFSGIPPVNTYGSATGPFPDLPEELASRVASYLRQARSKGVGFFTETNTPLAGVVHIWDMPGQALYSALASLLMVRHGIYVVTFDLSLDLHMPSPADGGNASEDAEGETTCNGRASGTYLESIVDSLDFVRACTSHHQDSASVQRLVPAIVIVGTHMDLLGPADSDTVKQLARERFATVKRALQGRLSRKYVTFPFFAVDCTNSGQANDNADLLRFHIEDLTQSYFPTAWPYSYLRFEQILETERRRGLVCQPLNDVLKMTKTHCLLDPPATYTMLCHMHNLGIILYLPHIARMDDLVVIRPQWLLGAINRLICTPPADYESGPLADCWRRLVTEGVLEERLVTEVWQDYGTNQGLLLDMMQRLDLLCPSLPHLVEQHMEAKEDPESPSAEGSVYYLPSMVQGGPDSEEFLQSLSPERDSAALTIVFADNYMPTSLFPHLLHRCLVLCPMRPRIFKRCARLVIDSDHDLHLLTDKGTLQVIIETTDYSSPASPPSSDVCVEMLRFIQTCLHEFEWQYEHGIDFEVCVECCCSQPPPPKPSSASVNLSCAPDGKHYAKLPSFSANSAHSTGGLGDEMQFVCARGSEISPALDIQVWINPDAHQPDSHSVAEFLHYNIRHRLSQLLDPHLSGHSWQILGGLLGFSPHELVPMERRDSPTMALIEAWEGRRYSTVARLREKIALLRCEDAIDLLDSV